MKKSLLTILFFSLVIHLMAQNNRTNILKISSNGLEYEFALNKHSSFAVDLPIIYLTGTNSSSFTSGGQTIYSSNNETLFGIGIGGQYRYYFETNKNAPRGFYVSPGASALFGNDSQTFSDGTSQKTNFNYFVARGVFGHQWVWGGGFSLDLNLGYAYRHFSYSNSTDNFSGIGASGLGIAGSMGLGWAF